MLHCPRLLNFKKLEKTPLGPGSSLAMMMSFSIAPKPDLSFLEHSSQDIYGELTQREQRAADQVARSLQCPEPESASNPEKAKGSPQKAKGKGKAKGQAKPQAKSSGKTAAPVQKKPSKALMKKPAKSS